MLSVLLISHNDHHTSHAEITNEPFGSSIPVWLGRKLFRSRAEYELPVQNDLSVSAWKLVSFPSTGIDRVRQSYRPVKLILRSRLQEASVAYLEAHLLLLIQVCV